MPGAGGGPFFVLGLEEHLAQATVGFVEASRVHRIVSVGDDRHGDLLIGPTLVVALLDHPTQLEARLLRLHVAIAPHCAAQAIGVELALRRDARFLEGGSDDIAHFDRQAVDVSLLAPRMIGAGE